jgi:hypothetical protein
MLACISTRDRLRDAVTIAPNHLKDICAAVRDGLCGFGLVGQHAGPFQLPDDRPLITIIGDDLAEALGPAAFHRKSLCKLLNRADMVLIVSSAPTPSVYRRAAAKAARGGNVVIVETRLERETEWLRLIQRERHRVELIVSTVEPAGHA